MAMELTKLKYLNDKEKRENLSLPVLPSTLLPNRQVYRLIPLWHSFLFFPPPYRHYYKKKKGTHPPYLSFHFLFIPTIKTKRKTTSSMFLKKKKTNLCDIYILYFKCLYNIYWLKKKNMFE